MPTATAGATSPTPSPSWAASSSATPARRRAAGSMSIPTRRPMSRMRSPSSPTSSWEGPHRTPAPDPGRLPCLPERRHPVAHPDLASDDDPRAEPPAVDQPLEHARPGELLEVRTRLAEADSPQPRPPDQELPSHQVIEGRAAGDDVPARVARLEVHSALAPEGLDGFELDERHLPVAADPVGERPLGVEVPVTVDALPGDRLEVLQGAHRLPLLRREMQRHDFAGEGQAGHAHSGRAPSVFRKAVRSA